MNKQHINLEAKAAFDKQSTIFDETYATNKIIAYKRERTRSHIERYTQPGGTILELNAGTGQDSVYFAQKGYSVHATDVSEGMLYQLAKKVDTLGLSEWITYEKASFTNLENLSSQNSYDAIFSNFGGLNCTNKLGEVINSFSTLLNEGGIVTLVIMPPFCLWEFLQLLRGRFKVAFRRFFAKKGAKAQIDGIHFLCWYYTPSYVIKTFGKDFDLISLEGLCTLVPPSYMENFPEKYPYLWKRLEKLENKLKSNFLFRYVGDYFIITLRKNGHSGIVLTK